VGTDHVTIRATPLGRVAPAKQLLYQVGVSTAVLPLLSLALGERWSLDFSAFAWARCWCRRWWARLPATWRGCGC
jgi:hypothetical protein